MKYRQPLSWIALPLNRAITPSHILAAHFPYIAYGRLSSSVFAEKLLLDALDLEFASHIPITHLPIQVDVGDKARAGRS